MASIGATCGASQYENPPSSRAERRSRKSGYMREKHGREERGSASRQPQTKNLAEMKRGILHPKPRCGIATEKSLPALPDRCRTSLEIKFQRGKWWLKRKPCNKVSQTKDAFKSCASSGVQRDLTRSAPMASVPWSPASHESLIGPPSELIHIDDFLRSESAARVLTVPDLPQQLSESVIDPVLQDQDSIASECRWVSRTNNTTTR
jgi:hypothetical protein